MRAGPPTLHDAAASVMATVAFPRGFGVRALLRRFQWLRFSLERLGIARCCGRGRPRSREAFPLPKIAAGLLSVYETALMGVGAMLPVVQRDGGGDEHFWHFTNENEGASRGRDGAGVDD